ncbi:IclR family transcriptional regulator [Fodinicurvata fenggangensis]|uniref:IclR family transcriptional regulator n=1 Tax=Fodinicurvata fenggangensis TaxID=1121830 RepID=UPI0005566180|nr:IclR family transcriptional regulator [Fodinicurvata fenggangensis]
MNKTSARKDSSTESEEREAPQKGVAAVDRALSILSALESEPEPLTLSDLSRKTGLYKSTILRLIETLHAYGYVVRILETRYALGPTVYRMGMAYERRNPLREHVLPIFQRLVENGTESPSFHIRHDAHNRLCLFRQNSNHSTLDRVHVGDILPLDRGAAGKVILAFEGQTDEESERIRAQHHALSLGERDASCAGIAAPVFGADGGLVGSLSMSGPRERFTEENVARMRPLLMEAVQEITESLGGRYPQVAA